MFKTIGLSFIYLIIFLGLYGCSCSSKPKKTNTVPGLYISDISVRESDGGTTNFEIAVNLQRDNQNVVTVNYSVAEMAGIKNSVATAGSDFTEKTGILTFDSQSDSIKTISLTVVNDLLYEYDEKFLVVLSAASGANIVSGQATVTIKDNDPKPLATLSITDSLTDTILAENDAKRVQMKVALDKVSGVDSTISIYKSIESEVDKSTIGKVAAHRIDYLLKDSQNSLVSESGVITIPAGETEVPVNLDVIDDGIPENTEIFSLSLGNPIDATVSAATLEFQITDNDQPNPDKSFFVRLNDTGIIEDGYAKVTIADLPSGGYGLTDDEAIVQGELLARAMTKEMDKCHGRDTATLLVTTQVGCGLDAATLTKVGGGQAGFDFTKLDSNGKETTAVPSGNSGSETIPWDCVRDNNTGLVWEAKVHGDAGLRAESRSFNWYDPNYTTNGGDAGVKGDYRCDESLTECNTAYYVADINAVKLCGMTGWRLPTINELRSIVNYGKPNTQNSLAYDSEYFADDLFGTAYVWTSTTYSRDPSKVWVLRFGQGITEELRDKSGQSVGTAIRLVNDSLLKQVQ